MLNELHDIPVPVSGMRVIITGATRGIGVGIAHVLANAGARLCLGYHSDDSSAEKLKSDLISESGSEVIQYKGDLTTLDGIGGLVNTTVGKFGGLDALVSNMGPFLYRPIIETTNDEWELMVRANLSTHFYLVREILPSMRSQGYGNFVFIGGVGTGQITGHKQAAAYNSAKVGLAEFMRTLAIEESRNGIRSNMICPGIIDNGDYSDGFRERIVNDIPLGYIGQPEDIANAVRWLLSLESRYVTGAIIDVSGGYHLVPH